VEKMIKNYLKSKILQAFARVYVYVYLGTERGEYIVYEGNLRDIFFRAKMFNNRWDLPDGKGTYLHGKLRIVFQFVDI